MLTGRWAIYHARRGPGRATSPIRTISNGLRIGLRSSDLSTPLICRERGARGSHRSQTVICTLTVKSRPLQNFETSCTARRFLLHDFQIGSSGARETVSRAPGLKRFSAWIRPGEVPDSSGQVNRKYFGISCICAVTQYVNLQSKTRRALEGPRSTRLWHSGTNH